MMASSLLIYTCTKFINNYAFNLFMHIERWLEDEAEHDILGEKGEGKRRVQGLWGNMLSFGGGNPVNGNRSCIGYRFALSECVFFFVPCFAR